MAPIFSNNTKYLESSVQNGTDIFVTEKQYLQLKPHLNRLKWHRVILWRHNDVFRDEIRVIAPHKLNEKNYNFDPMQLRLFSVANTFTDFAL